MNNQEWKNTNQALEDFIKDLNKEIESLKTKLSDQELENSLVDAYIKVLEDKAGV